MRISEIANRKPRDINYWKQRVINFSKWEAADAATKEKIIKFILDHYPNAHKLPKKSLEQLGSYWFNKVSKNQYDVAEKDDDLDIVAV